MRQALLSPISLRFSRFVRAPRPTHPQRRLPSVRGHMYPVVCVCLPACVAPAAPGSMRPIAPKTTLKYEFESRAVGARAIRCWFPSGPSLFWFCLLPSALVRPLGRDWALRGPYRRDTCVERPPSRSLHSLLSTAFHSAYLIRSCGLALHATSFPVLYQNLLRPLAHDCARRLRGRHCLARANQPY